MLLILRSRAAFSLLSGSFGSLRFFSLGTSLARGWRCPTGAWIVPLPPAPLPPPPEFFGTDDAPCANASAPPIRTISAIERIVFRMLVLPSSCFFLSHRRVDRCAVTASLGGAVLRFSYIGHGGKQPDSSGHQNEEEAEHHGIFDSAIAVVFRRLPFPLAVLRHRRSRRWRIEVNVAAIVDDTIPRFRG